MFLVDGRIQMFLYCECGKVFDTGVYNADFGVTTWSHTGPCDPDWIWEDPDADDDESHPAGFNDTFEDWPDDDDEA